MKPNGWLTRHGPFLLLVGFLFVLAFYVDQYLDAFTYILLNSRLFFQIFLGITVIAVLRNVVGLRGFGTFGPAIVALAFLQAGLLYGTILLAIEHARSDTGWNLHELAASPRVNRSASRTRRAMKSCV